MIKVYPVIKCIIADSSDYDYMWDSGIHNTISPIRSWAGEQGINVSFERTIDRDLSTYSLRLLVNAIFDDPAHLALFKLSFTEMPYQQLKMNDMQPIFY